MITFGILVVALVVVVALLASAFGRSSKSAPKPGARQESPASADSGIKVTLSVISSGPERPPDMGPVERDADGSWLLNPRACFRIAVTNCGKEVAEEIKGVLDKNYWGNRYDSTQQLLSILVRSNARFREVDKYLTEARPKYLKRLEEMKEQSSEWLTASEKDREDLLAEFRQQAVLSLDVRPDCDLKTLLECEPSDLTVDDLLIKRFSFEAVQFYLRHSRGSDKVWVVSAEEPYRKEFERLLSVGLAERGVDIPLVDILNTLTLKEMGELVADLDHPKFTRKAKAIEYLTSVRNIRERAGRHIAFRELFKLRPLPAEFSALNVDQLASDWSFAHEVARVIANTYWSAGDTTRQLQDREYIDGWMIRNRREEEACPHCRRFNSRKFSKSCPPPIPFHLGCSCYLRPVYRDQDDEVGP